MRVGIVQFTATDDKQDNRRRLADLVRAAADGGAELVVAPEAAMHPFGSGDTPLAPVAEALDGAFVTTLREVARERRTTVVAGMFESVDEASDRAFNTVVAVDAAGDVIGSYRKQHLFDALGWVESQRLQPGRVEDRLVFPCGEVTVGVMTCYDLRFPELARVLADDGATLLAVPSAWVNGPLKEEQWTTLLRARAIENVLYVAAADQSPPTYTGRAMVVDPFGVVVGALAEKDGVVVVDVEAGRVAACRVRMPSLSHRRWRVEPR